jgi:hypothetical protein
MAEHVKHDVTVACSAIMTGRDAQDEDEKYDEDDYVDDIDDGLVMDDAGGKPVFSCCGEYLKPVIF